MRVLGGSGRRYKCHVFMLHTRRMPKALYCWFVWIHRSLLSRLQRLDGSTIWKRDIRQWKVDRCAVRPHGTESYVTKYGLPCLKNVGVPHIALSGSCTLYVHIAGVKFVSKGCVCVVCVVCCLLCVCVCVYGVFCMCVCVRGVCCVCVCGVCLWCVCVGCVVCVCVIIAYIQSLIDLQ
jgi:hypothetical protein